MIAIYLGIPLIVVTIADLRARKGKKSKALLTIVFILLTLFNIVATLNANGKGEDKVVLTGIILIAADLIVYFTSIYITGKQAEKCKKNSENSSGK